MKFKRMGAALLIVAAAVFPASCSKPDSLFDSDTKSLTEPDTTSLRVAVAPEEEPFVYTDGDGNILGFDAALSSKLAERFGVTAVFYPMKRDSLADSLNCGLADMALSALEATDVLRRKVNFSDAYITLTSAIVANGGNSEINDTDDLKSAQNIGSIYGSLSLRYLKEELGLLNVSEYPDRSELEGAMLRGDIDIMFCDSFAAAEFVSEYPLFAIKEDGIDRHRYAVAVARDNTKLLRKVEEVLEEFRSDNTLLDLRRAYINGDDGLRAEYNTGLKAMQQNPENQ